MHWAGYFIWFWFLRCNMCMSFVRVSLWPHLWIEELCRRNPNLWQDPISNVCFVRLVSHKIDRFQFMMLYSKHNIWMDHSNDRDKNILPSYKIRYLWTRAGCIVRHWCQECVFTRSRSNAKKRRDTNEIVSWLRNIFVKGFS